MSNRDLPILRWGILGCGRISSYFVADICIERAGATTNHIIQAVGSRSKDKALQFAKKNCPGETPQLYGSYEEVYNDPAIDIVYVATPHPLHKEMVLSAINNGKHVLCEKPAGMNAKEIREMMDAAREHNVFFMEGMWIRFFPLTKKLLSLLHDEKVIGDITAAFIDFGMYQPYGSEHVTTRSPDRELGAGSLLDLGIYSLTWASLALDRSPLDQDDAEPVLSSSMLFHTDEKSSQKNIDEQTTITLNYPSVNAQAVCISSMLYTTGEEFASIKGSKGSISICGISAALPRYLVVKTTGEPDQRVDFELQGLGFYYEADAIAEAIRGGKLETDICSWEHSLTIMKRMDEARRQAGLAYSQDA